MVSELLPPAALSYLDGEGERMLRDIGDKLELDEALGEAPCRVGPKVMNRRTYSRFVKDLAKRGMLRFSSSTILCGAGMFFVLKKDGSLRLILDCRAGNRFFVDPPSVDLITSEGLSRIEVKCKGGLDDLWLPLRAHLGSADVENSFHNMGMPRWMSLYFGLPIGTAAEFGIVNEKKG